MRMWKIKRSELRWFDLPHRSSEVAEFFELPSSTSPLPQKDVFQLGEFLVLLLNGLLPLEFGRHPAQNTQSLDLLRWDWVGTCILKRTREKKTRLEKSCKTGEISKIFLAATRCSNREITIASPSKNDSLTQVGRAYRPFSTMFKKCMFDHVRLFWFEFRDIAVESVSK